MTKDLLEACILANTIKGYFPVPYPDEDSLARGKTLGKKSSISSSYGNVNFIH
jgi:hypothetical protein